MRTALVEEVGPDCRAGDATCEEGPDAGAATGAALARLAVELAIARTTAAGPLRLLATLRLSPRQVVFLTDGIRAAAAAEVVALVLVAETAVCAGLTAVRAGDCPYIFV